MTVGGKSVGGTGLPVVDPATGETFAEAPLASEAVLDEALRSARSSQPAWAAQPIDERRSVLVELGEGLAARADEVATVLTRENGKPLREAMDEVTLAAQWFGWIAGLELEAAIARKTPDSYVRMLRVPLGVVGAITPWNYPIILAVVKIAPALLAGNTVVLKPSPHAPLSPLLMGETLAPLLPAGVLNVLSGGDTLGERLVSHGFCDMVSLTGSVSAGRSAAVSAARDLKKAILELGGNDAAIVFPDVDIDGVAEALFAAAFVNAGQFCAAVKRVYAHKSIARSLADRLAMRADATIVGNGLDARTQMGPLTIEGQVLRVDALVATARSAGGQVLAGGYRIDAPGFFYRPTIVFEPSTNTALEVTEQFGPALPVMEFVDLDEAVSRANATSYGLGASVWTGNGALAQKVASRLKVGTVWVNTHGELSHDVPFGGVKSSGMGVEYGQLGLEEFTQLKVVSERLH